MNGYRNWDHYNVAIWMHNDKKLYRTMISAVQDSATLEEAIVKVWRTLNNVNRPGAPVKRTPDGVLYTLPAVREAMEGQELEEFLGVNAQAAVFNMEPSDLQDFISGS